MIEVRGLSKRYGGTVALRSLDFEVHAGEIVGLLGPNGAGKTTCMRILSGYLAASAGQVRVAGVDVTNDSLAARRKLGYLPEGVPIYPELRVEEYLSFRARLRGLAGRPLAEEVGRVSELCHLGSVARRLTRQLSRGFRQRVGLADAMLGRPAVLILDEPTAGLDPNQMREVRALIRAAASQQTVLLSTHILSEVEALCGRALIVDRGSLVAQGDVRELLQGQDGEAVLLELRGPLEQVERQLLQLGFVDQVAAAPIVGDVADALRCRLSGRFDADAMEQLARAVAQAGWTLRSLQRTGGRLEQVFARLTAGDGSAP